MENPKISVLMPAYNSEKYIGVAIESILNQTFSDFEFIIIDDCSKDKTWNIITTYAAKDDRIIPLRNEINMREAKTLNRGIGIARGKYIARIDNDDWSYPDRLKKQYNFMEEHSDVGISGGTINICDGNLQPKSQRKYALSDKQIRQKMFRYSPFCHPTVIIRRSILILTGLYNPDYYPPNDYELYFRIGLHSKFANLSDTLLKYRVLDNSITHTSTKRLEILTIAIRNKYAKAYHMTFFDRLYNILQYLSIFIIPSWIKIRIFNFFRDDKLSMI